MRRRRQRGDARGRMERKLRRWLRQRRGTDVVVVRAQIGVEKKFVRGSRLLAVVIGEFTLVGCEVPTSTQSVAPRRRVPLTDVASSAKIRG